METDCRLLRQQLKEKVKNIFKNDYHKKNSLATSVSTGICRNGAYRIILYGNLQGLATEEN
jgi:hypothetical protein